MRWLVPGFACLSLATFRRRCWLDDICWFLVAPGLGDAAGVPGAMALVETAVKAGVDG